ncbi:protein N-terminal glutamine amidohydrolase isoform X1 [Coccinella septempunctata]|uniref:protein N-terminal glutamine amidohydrolase isoform X1 n=1 Tax=Coccinella septempunctata TaxID=41139 RepID=UPI001D07C558|nr:protein N-terminal glutamine amidohydrolase isoform X1 [Coccinella septempunctata]
MASITSENKGNSKNIINLFPKSADCSYVSCYCEENVFKLCEDVTRRYPGEIQNCSVVFVSNARRKVPLWKQRAGKDEDKLVIWDYHVIFLYHPEPQRCLVYDLDSDLPFPTYVHKYITETFRTDHILKSDYFRFFRVVPAKEFLNDFSSDRRHMKRPDGTWIKPPPSYSPITNSNNPHNLEDFIQMDPAKGPGEVLSLTQFVQRFYKPAT